MSASLIPRLRARTKTQTGTRVRTMRDSPPHTRGSLSIPRKASPRSRTIHCSSCALSAWLMVESKSSQSLCIVMMSSLTMCSVSRCASGMSVFVAVAKVLCPTSAKGNRPKSSLESKNTKGRQVRQLEGSNPATPPCIRPSPWGNSRA